MWSCAVPCEKLRRTTSTPARIIRSSTSGVDDAGPRVATILVARGTGRIAHESSRCALRFASTGPGLAASRAGARASLGPRAPAASCLRAPRGRHRPGRDVVTSVRCRTSRSPPSVSPPPAMLKRRCGNRPRNGLACRGERVELEDADRAVPDDRPRRLQQRRAARRVGPMSRISSSASTSATAFIVAGASALNSSRSRRRPAAEPPRRAPSSPRSRLSPRRRGRLGQALADRRAAARAGRCWRYRRRRSVIDLGRKAFQDRSFVETFVPATIATTDGADRRAPS